MVDRGMETLINKRPIKISRHPKIQERIDDHKKLLEQQLRGTGVNEQGITYLARNNTAHEIRIKKLRERSQTAEANSMTDPLTGLHNRRWFDDELLRRIAEAQRTGRKLWLFFFDLDKFKRVNSRYGHPGGDQILKAVSKLHTRAEEPIARLGGEEFAQLSSEISSEEDIARIMTRYMNELLENTSNVLTTLPIQKGHEQSQKIPFMTMSFGAAEYNGEDGETFVKKANDMMLFAKRRGRNRGYMAETVEGRTVIKPIPKAS
ncbi:MAG: GGDEF domain-containing protein [Candidatus Levybacteria bacterium]|nr:GGDEF domain-containing protein [Candidatus Levybacteria bacterium]